MGQAEDRRALGQLASEDAAQFIGRCLIELPASQQGRQVPVETLAQVG